MGLLYTPWKGADLNSVPIVSWLTKATVVAKSEPICAVEESATPSLTKSMNTALAPLTAPCIVRAISWNVLSIASSSIVASLPAMKSGPRTISPCCCWLLSSFGCSLQTRPRPDQNRVDNAELPCQIVQEALDGIFTGRGIIKIAILYEHQRMDKILLRPLEFRTTIFRTVETH